MAIEQLEPFAGNWNLEADLPGSTEVAAHCTFEWILGGTFLLQRSTVEHPAAPDGHCIVGANPGGGYTQHYFDSRGVVRVYAMTFDGTNWELLRVTPDFTPLDFSQRYTGRFSEDGKRIEGRWESSSDQGVTWELDFELNYARR
jgi:hypothetical protein